jgi:hypothetical protein
LAGTVERPETLAENALRKNHHQFKYRTAFDDPVPGSAINGMEYLAFCFLHFLDMTVQAQF